MKISLEEKHKFLLDYPNYILDHVSLRFPLTHAQLTWYRKILSWDLITSNTSIAWSTDIIDDLTTELFPTLGPDELPDFSVNDSLPWHSVEFVKRYEHLWDWQAIAENNMLRGTCEEYFRDRLEQQGEYYQPYTELNENHESVFDSNYSSEDMNKPKDYTWTVERLNDFHRNNGDYNELLYRMNIV